MCAGVKPYACSMCDMRFFQRYHLARHTLTHTGIHFIYPSHLTVSGVVDICPSVPTCESTLIQSKLICQTQFMLLILKGLRSSRSVLLMLYSLYLMLLGLTVLILCVLCFTLVGHDYTINFCNDITLTTVCKMTYSVYIVHENIF